MADSDPPDANWRTVLVRWALAIAIGGGGMLLVRRIALRMQSDSATRVVLRDFSLFEGCMFGSHMPPDDTLPGLARALAQGTGDPAWPHSCAPPLSRLEHAAEDVAADDDAFAPLAFAVRAMENALGEAVFWTEHVRAGSREPPAWLPRYLALRRAVAAFASRRAVALPAPEPPRHPRVPRADSDPPPLPQPVSLPGGDDADLIDSIATSTEFAVALRDRRSQYTLCRWPYAPPDAPIRCEPFRIPRIADPRYAGFVPSERGAYLAVWGRAPYSLRGLVDVGTQRVALIAAGNPEAQRDFWVGPAVSMALQVNANGPSLLVDQNPGTRELPLPASVDVVGDQRALVGTPRGASLVWLEARRRAQAILHAISLGALATRVGADHAIAAWHEPRLTGPDRRLLACAVPSGPAYVLAGDGRGATLFATADGAQFIRVADASVRLDRPYQMICDASGVTLTLLDAGALEFTSCEAGRCAGTVQTEVVGETSVQRSGGAVVVADAGGVDHTVRVRRYNAPSASWDSASIAAPVPAARAVRLAAFGATVALFVSDHAAYSLRSRDGGRTFDSGPVTR